MDNPFVSVRYDYESLKALAKEWGIRRNDLLALSPQNDPFYCGAPASKAMASWFMDLWQRFGYTTGVHLRRIHYQAVSQDPPIIFPNGRTYKNTDKSWEFLIAAAKYSRYLGLIDPEAFIDRRNPDPLIFTQENYSDPEPGVEVYSDWDPIVLPALPDLPILPRELPDLPSIWASGYEGVFQDYHLELWAEKSTMNDVLIPICERFGVNLITGLGEMSITSVIDFLKRAAQSERPARILFISDFDPAGMGMPISVARKIEFYQRNNGELEICLQPIVLTRDQVKQYKLPRIPIKETELKRGHFENAFGTGATELDALEALFPGEFERIVTEAILQYYDVTLTNRALDEKQSLQEDLDHEWQAIINNHSIKLQTINSDYKNLTAEFEGLRQDFAKLAETFSPKLEAYRSRLAEIMERAGNVHSQLKADLDNLDQETLLDYHDLPEAEVDGDPEMLYDSKRDYFEQLACYKDHQAGY